MKELILIGGAAGTGKTELAKQLSAHLSIPWISTDQIRTIRDIRESDENKQAALVWEGVSALIHAPHPWEGGVIEGIAILPEFVARDCKDVPVKTLFLIQENADDIARVIAQRALLPWIKTKSPEEQAAKVERLILQNREIRKTAEEFEFPYIIGGSENTFKEALKALGLGNFILQDSRSHHADAEI